MNRKERQLQRCLKWKQRAESIKSSLILQDRETLWETYSRIATVLKFRNITLLTTLSLLFSSCSVLANSVTHGLQHTRFPCPSPAPRACSNSCPLSQQCRPASRPIIPSSSCLQSFPASGSLPKCQFFTSGAQSVGPSASASVLPGNIQDWFPLGLTGLISL